MLTNFSQSIENKRLDEPSLFLVLHPIILKHLWEYPLQQNLREISILPSHRII